MSAVLEKAEKHGSAEMEKLVEIRRQVLGAALKQCKLGATCRKMRENNLPMPKTSRKLFVENAQKWARNGDIARLMLRCVVFMVGCSLVVGWGQKGVFVKWGADYGVSCAAPSVDVAPVINLNVAVAHNGTQNITLDAFASNATCNATDCGGKPFIGKPTRAKHAAMDMQSQSWRIFFDAIARRVASDPLLSFFAGMSTYVAAAQAHLGTAFYVGWTLSLTLMYITLALGTRVVVEAFQWWIVLRVFLVAFVCWYLFVLVYRRLNDVTWSYNPYVGVVRSLRAVRYYTLGGRLNESLLASSPFRGFGVLPDEHKVLVMVFCQPTSDPGDIQFVCMAWRHANYLFTAAHGVLDALANGKVLLRDFSQFRKGEKPNDTTYVDVTQELRSSMADSDGKSERRSLEVEDMFAVSLASAVWSRLPGVRSAKVSSKLPVSSSYSVTMYGPVGLEPRASVGSCTLDKNDVVRMVDTCSSVSGWSGTPLFFGNLVLAQRKQASENSTENISRNVCLFIAMMGKKRMLPSTLAAIPLNGRNEHSGERFRRQMQRLKWYRDPNDNDVYACDEESGNIYTQSPDDLVRNAGFVQSLEEWYAMVRANGLQKVDMEEGDFSVNDRKSLAEINADEEEEDRKAAGAAGLGGDEAPGRRRARHTGNTFASVLGISSGESGDPFRDESASVVRQRADQLIEIAMKSEDQRGTVYQRLLELKQRHEEVAKAFVKRRDLFTQQMQAIDLAKQHIQERLDKALELKRDSEKRAADRLAQAQAKNDLDAKHADGRLAHAEKSAMTAQDQLMKTEQRQKLQVESLQRQLEALEKRLLNAQAQLSDANKKVEHDHKRAAHAVQSEQERAQVDQKVQVALDGAPAVPSKNESNPVAGSGMAPIAVVELPVQPLNKTAALAAGRPDLTEQQRYELYCQKWALEMSSLPRGVDPKIYALTPDSMKAQYVQSMTGKREDKPFGYTDEMWAKLTPESKDMMRKVVVKAREENKKAQRRSRNESSPVGGKLPKEKESSPTEEAPVSTDNKHAKSWKLNAEGMKVVKELLPKDFFPEAKEFKGVSKPPEGVSRNQWKKLPAKVRVYCLLHSWSASQILELSKKLKNCWVGSDESDNSDS